MLLNGDVSPDGIWQTAGVRGRMDAKTPAANSA